MNKKIKNYATITDKAIRKYTITWLLCAFLLVVDRDRLLKETHR